MLPFWLISQRDSAACASQRRVRLGGQLQSAHDGARIDRGARHGHKRGMLIYKIFRRPEWDAFRAAGETLGAPIDLADGYIHFSTAAQVAETAAKCSPPKATLSLWRLTRTGLAPP